VAVEAVNEVGNPTILATFAVIAAVLPMAFVGGLMGPYMRPIPIGASAAMFFSLAIAFIVTPWAAVRLLRGRKAHVTATGGREDFFTRIYRRVMGPLIRRSRSRKLFLIGITALLLLAASTVPLGWVKVKMLPFDNKSEFQVILNMPEGSSLERTTQAAREIAAAVRHEPEVTDYQIYAGVAAPFNFNGLVRHYFLRSGAHVADLQVNLVSKHDRKAQSHDIVKRVRPRVAEIARRYGARVAVAEVPPGPPVLQTLVAEVYGPTEESRHALARCVRDVFRNTPGVVDVDWYLEADQPKARFVIDKEKAALHGISAETVSQTLRIAVAGESVDLLHQPWEKEDINILLQLPLASRTSPEELLSLRVRSGDANALPEPGGARPAPLVPLRELVQISQTIEDKSIYHKNLMPVTYVIGDVAGEAESPVYAILKMNKALRKLDMERLALTPSLSPGEREKGPLRATVSNDPVSSLTRDKSLPLRGGEGRGEDERDLAQPLKILNAVQPFSDLTPAIKWDGEWHITIEVFRDLGLAFAAVLVLIYALMVGWFQSFLTPLVVMAAIPFSLVGILPAHGALGAFFTATSMIGFIAGAGIVVRNSIILVDFIEQRLREGCHWLMPSSMPARCASPDAVDGSGRGRGASVILFDPISRAGGFPDGR
jgi:multidrug efflux pump subunit AcrB